MAGGGAIASASGSRADLYNGGLNLFVILVAILVSAQVLGVPLPQGGLACDFRDLCGCACRPCSASSNHLPPYLSFLNAGWLGRSAV